MSPLFTDRFRPWPRLLTLLGILALCAASSSRSCSFGSSDDDDSGDGGNDPTFVTTLQLQDVNGDVTDTFERGELIQMIITIRNRRDEAESIEFDTTRTSDFIVVRENTNDVVWQLSEETAASAPTLTTLDFAPNESKTFTTTWDQTASDDGDQVRTGAYEARGVVIFDGFDDNPLRASQLGSQLERFTIN
jgi:hypothetical protein